MKNRDLRAPAPARSAARLLVAGLLPIFFAACSNAGLHLPGSLWPLNQSAKATAATSRESIAGAMPYTPPPPPPPSPDTIDTVVASVDGNPITSHDIVTFNQGHSKDSLAQAGGAGDNVADDPAARLKALITQQLIEQESQKYASRVDDGDVDRFIQNLEEREHITDDQLRAQIQAQGMSYAAFRANVRRQVQAMAMFQHEVRDKVVVSDADIESYYKEHPEEFNVSAEKYRLAQILISVPAGANSEQVSAAEHKARDVRDQAAKGKDFSDLARQFSDDDSKNAGGELGEFSPSDLNDAIAAGIKDVKPGGISAVIRTKYGFHIIKVEEHEVPGGTPLSEVKAAIRQKLQGDRSKGELQRWVDQDLVKEHYVETNE